MTVFLLIFSFIIDGVLLFALFIMMKKVRKTEELELRQKQVASEIEDLFTSYLMEIKEENKRMESLVRKKSAPSDSQNTQNENRNDKVNSHSEKKVIADKEASPSYTLPELNEKESYQPSFHSQVFELKEKGYSNEEIARKLDKGKTEIELLFKFHQKPTKKT
ncbi:DUF6115 domain-containing protein [Halobacillus sp. SY10]|uniref:Swarming motility protein SwrB n=2 Tax=Halobacillus TaxID=45667 RepID=A0A1H0MSG8_HALAD|nr:MULTISPECIES: hypothetical protein [Halobacillus]RDY72131.1 hypothetical protein DXT76_03285 [Halobacillus trueperi]SDO83373.1 hypothetical protein SAMN05421677_108127 [Halobacillus aidingensis]